MPQSPDSADPADASPQEDVLNHSEGVYQHSKRPDWGVAILAWEKGDKRAYQFDDGSVRVLKAGFYDMMQEVDAPAAQAAELLNELNRRLKEAPDTRKRSKDTSRPLKPLYSFADQLRIFAALYPEGFAGKKWTQGVRGEGASKRLKRHRDPAIAQARELFAVERLDDAIAADRCHDVVADATKVLKDTDLVANNDIGQLRSFGAADDRALAKGLRNLLHGEQKYGSRYQTWLEALRRITGGDPSWQLTTALPALFDPEEQVCVRHASFMRQAAELAPTLAYSKRAGRQTYTNFHKVALGTRRRLASEGLNPRDYLDVHDFICATLRPSAAKYLED